MTKPAGRGSPAMQLRLPEDLKVWLHHRAIDNRRSLNSEVLLRIERTVNEDKAKLAQGEKQ